jgi:tetratricopeptide (TPR) repeat protein
MAGMLARLPEVPSMKLLCAWSLLLFAAGWARAAEPTLNEARHLWLRGNYEEARALYEKLAKDAKSASAAAVGLSRTWQSQGEYEKALAVVTAALAGQAKDADLQARHAELLYLLGRWQESRAAADKALALKPDDFLARWVQGQIHRDRGDLKQADDDFRWFVRTYTERSSKDNDIKDPDELLIVGLAGAENARWHNLSDQYRVILTDVYADALKADKNFWPAEYQAGMLLLEKYNRGEAVDAFAKALAINPHAAEALVGKGLAALQRFEIKEAELFTDQALKINPSLPEALRLRADLHLVTGNGKGAAEVLNKGRQVNARDESTLGRVAACLHLQRDQRGFDQLVAEVQNHDPKPGVFYYELAERLEERRQFEAAETFYKKAIELRPMMPWPRNSLGLLYMRLGRESEATEILTKAFKADEFNVRVSNMLKVLRHLEKYETLRTPHFKLRFDPQNDRRLGLYMAQYLEDTYNELADKFQYHPAGPILVEVFNNHEMFSGRTIALPDLHTIGACTGRMVAMVSPNGRDIRQPFNWARVIRHELVHIFNLEQTNFQVPHWLTEGLAVINEGFPRPQQWNHLLVQRVASNELLSLDNIEFGFIRPTSPLEWHLAYCQSQLYVEYLKERYGPEKVGAMLGAYRDGLDTAAALAKVCGVDKETFEQGYRSYVEDVAKGIQGKRPERPMTYSQLQKAHEQSPEDLDLAARLAEQYLIRREKKEARKLADEVLAKRKTHALASYVKARLLLDAGDDAPAIALLEAAVDKQMPEPKVLQALGKLYYESRNFAKAAESYELASKAEPLESRWLIELARVYAQLGDKAKRIEVLKKLVPQSADDLDQRKRLAQMLLDANRPAEAEQYAREALEIDVRDAEAQEMLSKAYLAQNKAAQAQRLEKLLGK